MTESGKISKYVKYTEWIFLYLSITDTLGFTNGDSTLNLAYLTPIIVAVKWVLLLLLFVFIYKLPYRLNYKYIWVPILIWFVHFISSFGGALYFAPLTVLMLCVFCILPDNIKVSIYVKYRKWIIIMSAMGILAYLSFVFSLPIPYSLNEYYLEYEDAWYIDYYFSYLYLSGFEMRLCGLFNEPGFLGTIVAFILILEKFNLKKIGNIILLVSGCLTFSMAFYVLVVLFFVTKTFNKLTSIIIMLCVTSVLFAYIQNAQFEDPQIQHLVDRFKFDKSTGGFAGDNRTSDSFKMEYNNLFKSDEWIYGRGLYAADGKNFLTSSYKMYIYKFGVIGFLLIFGSLLISSYPLARKNKDGLIYLLCFFVSIYQRPNVYNMAFFLMLYGGLLYIRSKAKKQSILAADFNKR